MSPTPRDRSSLRRNHVLRFEQLEQRELKSTTTGVESGAESATVEAAYRELPSMDSVAMEELVDRVGPLTQLEQQMLTGVRVAPEDSAWEQDAAYGEIDAETALATASHSHDDIALNSADSYGEDDDSYGGDSYGGDPYGGDVNEAPVIESFQAIPGLADFWTISGSVSDDEDVEGLVVELGGIFSEYGLSATVGYGGSFQVTAELIGLEDGTATAQTTDEHGAQSDLAQYYVFV